MAVAFAIVSAAAALLMTGWVRSYALRAGMVDQPVERSSHAVPTPRGGGLAIAITLLAATALLWVAGPLDGRLASAIGIGGILIVIVAWIEDRRGVPAVVRAGAYLSAAAIGLYLQGGVSAITLGEWRIIVGPAGQVLVVLGLAWLINLYNFMDGTDALAATQAITAAVVAGLLFAASGDAGPAGLCLALASACAGFLYWNWPPARIFMGDTGSCLIGFSFGMLAVAGENSGAAPLAVWLVLLSLFVCDATLTLLLRLLRGEPWYRAHRSHAYQLLVHGGMSHRRLALCLLALNAVVLAPLALLAATQRNIMLPSTGVALGLAAGLWIAVQWRHRRRAPPG